MSSSEFPCVEGRKQCRATTAAIFDCMHAHVWKDMVLMMIAADDDDDDDGAADDDGNDDFELDHLAIRWPASETCDPTIYQDCTNMAPS